MSSTAQPQPDQPDHSRQPDPASDFLTGDRVALVTGASSGIGAESAKRLAKKGFVVHGVARRTDRLAELEQHGVRTSAMDVTDDASMTAGVQRILDEHGRIDVLVNNAGYGSYGAVEDVPIDEARRQFEVNVFGLARLVQLVLPTMRAQGQGRIINIGSMGGVVYTPFGAWYHATKFALEGFSDALRVEVAPFGIDVALVQPAGVRTEWNTIARTSLVERSEGGAYAENARKAAGVLGAADNRLLSSGPGAVARKVVRAATANTVRSRYAAARGARTLMLARRIAPDPVVDLALKRVFYR